MTLLNGTLAGAVVWMPPPASALSRAVEALLNLESCELVTEPQRPIDVLIVTIADQPVPDETARAVFALVERVKTCKQNGALPRRVIALLPTEGDGALAVGLTRTVILYLTAHTAYDDVRINAVHVPEFDEDRIASGARVALALASGWLDGMRGQVLRVGTGSRSA